MASEGETVVSNGSRGFVRNESRPANLISFVILHSSLLGEIICSFVLSCLRASMVRLTGNYCAAIMLKTPCLDGS